MKLQQIVLESALVAAREAVRDMILEDVTQYLALTLGKLKNKSPEEAFKSGDKTAVDLDHLTSIVVGLKILANSDHRAAFTRDDIGIQPNNPKELFKLFNDISKDGTDPGYVKKAFERIGSLAPTAVKKQRAEFEKLKVGTDAERRSAVKELETFSNKVTQAFGKLRAQAQKSNHSANDVKTLSSSTDIN